MTDAEAIEHFVARTASGLRELPLAEAVPYLRGLLLSVDADAFPELRRAYSALIESDAQLELLARPQGRLL